MIAGDLLGHRARLTPDKEALVDIATSRRLSYAELASESARLAAGISRLIGPLRGRRIGILAHNRLEFVLAFFAAGRTGAILVPLGTRLTANELAPIVRDAELSALLYEDSFTETVDALRADVEVGAGVRLDEGSVESGDPSVAELLELCAGAEAKEERLDPEDLWALLYTSGTTGAPKGVMIPHRQVLANAANTVLSWQLREDDRSPIFTPLYHAGGLAVFLTPLVAIGATIVLHRSFDPAEVLETFASERITVALGVPTIYRVLAEHEAFAETDLSAVRWLISGGAPLPAEIIERFAARGVTLKQGFGMTEVGVNCFAMSEEEARSHAGSIGKPLLLTEARIADASDHALPDDAIGELQLRGAHVCAGYWRNEDATRAAFTDDGYFRTGDLARRDSEGFFHIAGRKKDMIISGGVNIYPAEIETALLQNPLVADAALIGVPDERWGEVGVAFVVLAAGAPRDEEGLLAFLGERLARFKLPRAIITLEELPRTPYGKVRKNALAKSYLELKAKRP